MHRRLLPLLLLALVVVPAGPASATSCVGWPDDVGREVVQGRLPDLVSQSGRTEPFTDRYDFAVIGTVRSTDPATASPVRVEVDVLAALFQPVGPTVTLSMSDAGALLGYPFQVGRTYLIPVKATGEGGLRNYVMLCDPVAEVPPTEVSDYVATARASGTLATPSTTSPAPTAATVAPTSSHEARWVWPALVVGVLLLTAGVLTLRSRRRRAPGTHWHR